jgi:ABC-type transport system substrate-binding protein
VDPTEWGSFLSRWRARDFESFISYQAAGSDPDDALYQNFRGGSTFNAVGIDDPKFNELLDKGRSTTDRSQRQAIYKDAQLRADEVVPDIFLFTRTEYMGIRSNVQGFKLSPFATFTYRALRTVSLQP